MKTYILFAALTLVAGCSNSHTVSVLFQSPVAVHNGDDVRLDQTLIGEVSQVVREDKGTRVYLALDVQKSAELKEGSAALITSHEGEAYVSVFNFRAGKRPLAAGGELVALNNSMEYLGWQTGEAMDFTSGAVNEVATVLQQYFDSQDWAAQKQRLQQALDQLGKDANTAMEDLHKDYEALMEGLEQQTEQSREEVLQHYEALSKTLGEHIEKLIEQGEKVLADSLAQILEILKELVEKFSEQYEKNEPPDSTTT